MYNIDSNILPDTKLETKNQNPSNLTAELTTVNATNTGEHSKSSQIAGCCDQAGYRLALTIRLIVSISFS